MRRALLLLCLSALGLPGLCAQDHLPASSRPLPLSEPRPSKAAIEAWKSRRFGMFIHFGLYSELGGVWKGRQIQNGYSEQIMANGPFPKDEYAALAKSFDPEKFNADAIVALAKAAGMRYIVITAKHHDGFAMFGTRQSNFNIVDATPYHRDIVKELADACARGGLRFGVYYSTIDWHAPTGSPYVEGNSNPISDAHARFNAAQLHELLTGYGPLSEVWFDMGKPTPEQSLLFARTVHLLQRNTIVSGRVFNYEGDFTVMGDNEVPRFVIDEPWQTPASIFADTWGYRSWEERGDVGTKVKEKVTELVTVVSRGGNYILNIGPEGDGSVVPFEAEVLRGIGAWLKVNGEAIFGKDGAAVMPSPFRTLDFGFATRSGDKLYLFVKTPPQDGTLRLPGVQPGVRLGAPYLLGSAGTPIGAASLTNDGAEVTLNNTWNPGPAGLLPVVVVPLRGQLRVRSANTVLPAADGSLELPVAKADAFQNYNGQGYDAPATTYKLLWHVVPRPGRYHVEVQFTGAHSASTMALVGGSQPVVLRTQPGSGTVSGTIRLGSGDGELALTPKEPFVKGTPLPVVVQSLRLVPMH